MIDERTVFYDPEAVLEEAVFVAATEGKTAYVIRATVKGVRGWSIVTKKSARHQVVAHVGREMFEKGREG